MTGAVSIDVQQPLVFAVVADPTTLPQYAPWFAEAVTVDGDAWATENSGGPRRLEVLLDAVAGTIDFRFTAPDGGESMVFTRTVPNGPGSEFGLTLLLPDSASNADVQRHDLIVEEVLERLRGLCEDAQP